MSETVARARMFGFDGDWVELERHHYEKHPEGDVVFYEVAEKLERERDEARRERDDTLKEWDIARDGWDKALEERNKARRELAEALKEWEVVWNDVLEERKERNKAMRALEWIAGRYCHEKSTFQLAQEAYEMSSTARWTLQEIEQKEEAK